MQQEYIKNSNKKDRQLTAGGGLMAENSKMAGGMTLTPFSIF